MQLSLGGVTTAAVVVASRPTVSIAIETAAAVRTRSARRILSTTLRRVAAVIDPPARFLAAGQFEGLAERVTVTGALNSPQMVRALETAQPDLLVLTATGLVGAEVLGVPRTATLNSHPGLLPWVRGNGAVEHAIRNRIAVGVSVHHVDEGPDTGDVVLRQLVPVTPVDTLGSIRQKADELRWVLLASVVRQYVSGAAPPRTPQRRRFRSSRWPSSSERVEAERLVTDGEAYRRYCAWREIAGKDELPDEDTPFESNTFT